jgi:hypothetical protein
LIQNLHDICFCPWLKRTPFGALNRDASERKFHARTSRVGKPPRWGCQTLLRISDTVEHAAFGLFSGMMFGDVRYLFLPDLPHDRRPPKTSESHSRFGKGNPRLGTTTG